jgi:hypothetical protein
LAPNGRNHYNGGWNQVGLVALGLVGAISIGWELCARLPKLLSENDFGWVIGAISGAAIYDLPLEQAEIGHHHAEDAHEDSDRLGAVDEDPGHASTARIEVMRPPDLKLTCRGTGRRCRRTAKRSWARCRRPWWQL